MILDSDQHIKDTIFDSTPVTHDVLINFGWKQIGELTNRYVKRLWGTEFTLSEFGVFGDGKYKYVIESTPYVGMLFFTMNETLYAELNNQLRSMKDIINSNRRENRKHR